MDASGFLADDPSLGLVGDRPSCVGVFGGSPKSIGGLIVCIEDSGIEAAGGQLLAGDRSLIAIVLLGPCV